MHALYYVGMTTVVYMGSTCSVHVVHMPCMHDTHTIHAMHKLVSRGVVSAFCHTLGSEGIYFIML